MTTDFEIGHFYWIWLTIDPITPHEWVNDPMPARYEGVDDAGEHLWRGLDGIVSNWPTRWTGEEIALEKKP